MFDAALIEKCADPSLETAIVEQFIAEAGSFDPLAVTVKAGDRLVLVPAAKTEREAMETIKRFAGNAVVRVGVTQFPAGIGIKDVSELNTNLVDACENIRMGTALFAKVYRIVVRWYGTAAPEAFDDAVFAWKTGYFEGKAVFREPDPAVGTEEHMEAKNDVPVEEPDAEKPTSAADVEYDFNRADTRIDLSRIGVDR